MQTQEDPCRVAGHRRFMECWQAGMEYNFEFFDLDARCQWARDEVEQECRKKLIGVWFDIEKKQ